MKRQQTKVETEQSKQPEKQQKKRANVKRTVTLADKAEYFTVHYLPNYNQDYRHDLHAQAVKIGDFPGASNLPEEIRSSPDYVPGVYRITAVDAKRHIIKTWALEVPAMPEPEEFEPEGIEDDPEPAQRERFVYKEKGPDASMIRDTVRLALKDELAGLLQSATPQPAQSGSDTLTVAIDQLQKLRKLESTLLPNQPKETVIQQQPPATAEKPLEDRLLEVALTKLLEKGDESTVDKVLEILRPQREPSFMDSFGDLIRAGIENLPQIMRAVNMMNGARGPAQTVTATPATTNGQRPQPQLAQSEAATAPGQGEQQQPVNPAQRDFQRMLSRMVEDCLDNVSVEASADRIVAFAEAYPDSESMIDMLKLSDPGSVITQLYDLTSGIEWSQVPHAREWITDLQEALKDDDAGQPELQSGEAAQPRTPVS